MLVGVALFVLRRCRPAGHCPSSAAAPAVPVCLPHCPRASSAGPTPFPLPRPHRPPPWWLGIRRVYCRGRRNHLPPFSPPTPLPCHPLYFNVGRAWAMSNEAVHALELPVSWTTYPRPMRCSPFKATGASSRSIYDLQLLRQPSKAAIPFALPPRCSTKCPAPNTGAAQSFTNTKAQVGLLDWGLPTLCHNTSRTIYHSTWYSQAWEHRHSDLIHKLGHTHQYYISIW